MSYCFGDPNMIRKPRPGDWTPEETERLREYAKSGMTQEEAAKLLPGRSVRGIREKARKLRICWKNYVRPACCASPWTDSEVALLRKVAKTHTVRQAAELLERTRLSVERKAARLRIAFRKHGEAHPQCKLPKAKIAELLELKEQGLMHQEIAERLGVSAGAISHVVTFRYHYRESLPILLEEKP